MTAPATAPAIALPTDLLTITDLHADYGSVRVLEGMSMHVPQGGLVALVGSNGAGKSTPLRTLSGLHERRQARAGILSGGQQQMLAVAQALMHAPRQLMLDEPSLGLAPAIIDQLLDAVVQLRSQGMTILLVEQMVERALQIADTAFVLQNGRVIGHGPAAAMRGSDLIRQAYLGVAGSRAVADAQAKVDANPDTQIGNQPRTCP